MKTFNGEIPSRSQLQAWDDRDEELSHGGCGGSIELLDELEAAHRAKNPDERWNINTGEFEPNPAGL